MLWNFKNLKIRYFYGGCFDWRFVGPASPPPPSTASRSDKEAKHGPNQKSEISRKIQTKSENQIGTLLVISFGGHVNPKRTVGDVLENFVGAPAHSLRIFQIEDIIKGEALGPRKNSILAQNRVFLDKNRAQTEDTRSCAMKLWEVGNKIYL